MEKTAGEARGGFFTARAAGEAHGGLHFRQISTRYMGDMNF